jgi:predicted DNA repair protein MutK
VSAKAAGVVIDDAAVTPRYVIGFAAERELPIIRRIARGSLKNKVLFLLPAALLLSAFASWAIMPLLVIGALFLCFEGYEKLHQMLVPHTTHTNLSPAVDSRGLEDETVAGAIRTDFILSAEIMAISLAGIVAPNILIQALVLLAVALLVTAGVYGSVALIVKADDFGAYLAQRGGTITRAIGQVILRGMPPFLSMLSFVGMVAMFWVGGGIIVHGLHGYGIDGPEHVVGAISDAVRAAIAPIGGVLAWLAAALASAAFGVVIGAVTALVVVPILTPLWRRVRPADYYGRH